MKIFFKLFLVSILTFSIFACSEEAEEAAESTDAVIEKEHDEGDDHDQDMEFKFGMILVGPKDDKGWSQAHFEGGEYIEEISGGEMIVADMINPADSPNLTVDQVASDMIDEGAQLIFATSDA